MEREARCPHCQGPVRAHVQTSNDTLLRCRSCGILFLFPPPDSAEMLRRHRLPGYAEMSYFQGTNGAPPHGAKSAIDRLRSHLPENAHLLDVGAGTGDFTRAASQFFKVSALEPSPDLALKLRQSVDCPVIEAPFETLEATGAYDAVVMNDVLEHTARPPDVVAKAAAVLKPGGLLWIHTINTESLLYRLGPWLGRLSRLAPPLRYLLDRLFIPQHNWYFGRAALRAMVESQGFSVLEQGGLEFPIERLAESPLVMAGMRALFVAQGLLKTPTEQFLLARRAA